MQGNRAHKLADGTHAYEIAPALWAVRMMDESWYVFAGAPADAQDPLAGMADTGHDFATLAQARKWARARA